jgi:hypothetical protein
MSPVTIIVVWEIRDALRNRWVVVATLVLGVFARWEVIAGKFLGHVAILTFLSLVGYCVAAGE